MANGHISGDCRVAMEVELLHQAFNESTFQVEMGFMERHSFQKIFELAISDDQSLKAAMISASAKAGARRISSLLFYIIETRCSRQKTSTTSSFE